MQLYICQLVQVDTHIIDAYPTNEYRYVKLRIVVNTNSTTTKQQCIVAILNYNAYYPKLQCILHQTTGELCIILNKMVIILHYTTLCSLFDSYCTMYETICLGMFVFSTVNEYRYITYTNIYVAILQLHMYVHVHLHIQVKTWRLHLEISVSCLDIIYTCYTGSMVVSHVAKESAYVSTYNAHVIKKHNWIWESQASTHIKNYFYQQQKAQQSNLIQYLFHSGFLQLLAANFYIRGDLVGISLLFKKIHQLHKRYNVYSA